MTPNRPEHVILRVLTKIPALPEPPPQAAAPAMKRET
jgi:hypothetical protein